MLDKYNNSFNDDVSIDIRNNINKLNLAYNDYKFHFKDINEIIINFINSLSNKKVLDKINKIAVSLTKSQGLFLEFLFEIQDYDGDTWDQIIITEAELSTFVYKHYMIRIDTMVLEASDNLKISKDYKVIK